MSDPIWVLPVLELQGGCSSSCNRVHNRVVMNALSQRLVPDDLWELLKTELPVFSERTQGGGTPPVNQRRVLAAIVYILTAGCPWKSLPKAFDVSASTAHRRFTAWSAAGLWDRASDLAEHCLDPGLKSWIQVIATAGPSRYKSKPTTATWDPPSASRGRDHPLQ
ncbi:transposase [Nocardia aurantia]|uniref:transposase n=1 Tax=Nocardia aurantia TaxID=2585199 RepID=UPI0012975C8E